MVSASKDDVICYVLNAYLSLEMLRRFSCDSKIMSTNMKSTKEKCERERRFDDIMWT